MNTYKFTYYYKRESHEVIIKAENLLIAIGKFEYGLAYDKIYKIELKS